jgi:hypothetical protein
MPNQETRQAGQKGSDGETNDANDHHRDHAPRKPDLIHSPTDKILWLLFDSDGALAPRTRNRFWLLHRYLSFRFALRFLSIGRARLSGVGCGGFAFGFGTNRSPRYSASKSALSSLIDISPRMNRPKFASSIWVILAIL